MKFVLAACTALPAQDQSSCPGPRHPTPTSSCDSADVHRTISVRVAMLDTGGGGFSGGYVSSGSNVTPQSMADTAESVERHQYRACDIGQEIVERVRESFQRLGYFCVDVEPIQAEQTGKDQYKIAIHVHPGEQYKVKGVTFSGAKALSGDELQSIVRLKPNSRFDIATMRRSLEELRKSYAKKGYPNMKAVPTDAIDDESKTIAFDIKIDEGVPQQ